MAAIPVPTTPSSPILDELKLANERLESFAYVASHDLRAPLRAIMALSEWIGENLKEEYGEVPASVSADLTEIFAQGRRMDKLLTDLLDYSRIGNAHETKSPFNAEEVVLDCINLCRIPPDFSVRLEPGFPDFQCSKVELSIAVRNLLCNAIRHHDKASGKIVIFAGEKDGQGFLTVEDDGPGVPVEHREVIFEMFRTMSPKGGSGLGLGMVRKIAERSSGSVDVTGNPEGRGSRFSVRLPIREPGFARSGGNADDAST